MQIKQAWTKKSLAIYFDSLKGWWGEYVGVYRSQQGLLYCALFAF